MALVQGDEVAATTLTRADGWFQLRAPASGRYTLRAELLGYGRVEMLVEATRGEAVWVDLTARAEAVELEGLVAEVDRACETDPAAAARVARLWDEVSKAFRVAAVAEDQGLYRMTLDQWRRALDPDDLRVLEEMERREGRGNQRSSPFQSLPPEELAEGGYIQGDDRRGWRYYGPDARVLLSRSFQDAHCFGITDEAPEDLPEGMDGDAWTGIAFEPRDRSEPDVRGTLWIDGRTLEPRRLDFRYTDLPWPVDHEALGGRVGFRRLPDGPWIVSDWRIRMPVVDAEEYRPFASASTRLRHEVVRITEVGGQVRQVGRRGEEAVTLGETGTILGLVREPGGEPAEGAVVSLEGTFFHAVTREDGVFGWGAVPAGRYRVVARSPAMDSLELPGEGSVDVTVRPRGSTDVELVLPSVADLLAEQCAAPLMEGGRGILRGRVTPGEEGALEGAAVALSWSEVVDADLGAALASVQEATARARIPVGEDGRWMACGLPVDRAVTVAAVRDEVGRPATPPREVRLVEGAVEEMVLELPARADVAEAVELEGLTVEVEARITEDLLDMGVRRDALGRRFISYEDIRENIHAAHSAGQLVERQRIPGVGYKEDSSFDCVYLRRASSWDLATGGRAQLCATLVLDGIPAHGSVLRTLPPENVAGIALLTPAEAGARWGVGSGGGILYVWTHDGGGAPR